MEYSKNWIREVTGTLRTFKSPTRINAYNKIQFFVCIFYTIFKHLEYRVNVKVYYDDAMARVYSTETKVKQKLRSVMIFVEELFNEVDTLRTRVVIDAKNLKIERAPAGNNWVNSMR